MQIIRLAIRLIFHEKSESVCR